MEKSAAASGTIAEASPRLISLFLAYLRWYMPRHFHALRIAHRDRFPAAARPLIICINHPSWWDPLTILMLSRALTPGRIAYAPMEAEALSHYGFFRRIGAFAVDNTSSRAAAQFIRQAQQILLRPNAILWMTPEGRFTDVRQRPADWRPGVAGLTRHLEGCTVVPVAIEYTYWDERLPEILCSVGEPMQFAGRGSERSKARNMRLEEAMAALQDELAGYALTRDAAHFSAVFAGKAGVSATYDVWQRLKSKLKGKPYVAEHGMIAPK